jgi:hypothetical protein
VITTTEFLRRWASGQLDLPVVSLSPAPRAWAVTPAGESAAIAEPPAAGRDPLAQLRTLIGPGSSRRWDWAGIERDLGFRLPAGYKLLHEMYPAPFAVNGIFVAAPDELLSTHEMVTEGLAIQAESPGTQHRIYPEPGGLLLCVHTESRDLVCWDTTSADPDTWPLVNMDDGAVFPGTVTARWCPAARPAHRSPSRKPRACGRSGGTPGAIPWHVPRDRSGTCAASSSSLGGSPYRGPWRSRYLGGTCGTGPTSPPLIGMTARLGGARYKTSSARSARSVRLN